MSDEYRVLPAQRRIFVEKYRGKATCNYDNCTHRSKYRLRVGSRKWFACTKHLPQLEERADVERAGVHSPGAA